jgi:hypothetical protein
MKFHNILRIALSTFVLFFYSFGMEVPSIQSIQNQPYAKTSQLNLVEQQKFLIKITNQLDPSDILTIIDNPDHFTTISNNISTLLEIQKNEPETAQLLLDRYNQKLDQDVTTFIDWLVKNQTFPPTNLDFIEKYFSPDDQILKKYLILTYKIMYQKALIAQIKKNKPEFTTRELRFSKKIFESFLPYLNLLPNTPNNERLTNAIQEIINSITIKLAIKFISKINMQSSTENKIKYINEIIFLADNINNIDEQDKKNIKELQEHPSLELTIADELPIDQIQKDKFEKAWQIIYETPTVQYKGNIVRLGLERAITQYNKKAINTEKPQVDIFSKKTQQYIKNVIMQKNQPKKNLAEEQQPQEFQPEEFVVQEQPQKPKIGLLARLQTGITTITNSITNFFRNIYHYIFG